MYFVLLTRTALSGSIHLVATENELTKWFEIVVSA